MTLRFFEVETVDGRRFNIDGNLNTRSGVLKGNERAKTMKKRVTSGVTRTVLGAGAGMALGPVGNLGIKAGFFIFGKRGKDVVLYQGDELTVRLNRSVTRDSIAYEPLDSIAPSKAFQAEQVQQAEDFQSSFGFNSIKVNSSEIMPSALPEAMVPMSNNTFNADQQTGYVPVNHSQPIN